MPNSLPIQDITPDDAPPSHLLFPLIFPKVKDAPRQFRMTSFLFLLGGFFSQCFPNREFPPIGKMALWHFFNKYFFPTSTPDLGDPGIEGFLPSFLLPFRFRRLSS